ncbi:MAG: glycosyltransferase family A protein [Chloroflexi bacterium]|nr:glycosyltransferase family A protein [Chloroflexota bacterium]
MTDTERLLVSVIIPTFNRAGYLIEAIESVLAQSYRPIEIIVVDDGSTDGTAEEIVSHFGAAVRYAWQLNQGASVARNAGIALAQGDLLAFLDSDDLWEPEKLTLQVATLITNPDTEAVLGRVRQFYSPELSEEARSRLWCPDGLLPGYVPGALLIWRKAFLRVGLFEPQLRVGEFMSWMIRAREAELRTVMLEECVYRRRVHAANKGIARQDTIGPRAAILKAALDRRRQRAATEGHSMP